MLKTPKKIEIITIFLTDQSQLILLAGYNFLL